MVVHLLSARGVLPDGSMLSQLLLNLCIQIRVSVMDCAF